MDSGPIVVGVDSHLDLNVAVALDGQGRLLGNTAVPTTPAGHSQLLSWARTFGAVERVGIEGTGSYGAGLCRFLRGAGVSVLEGRTASPPGPCRPWKDGCDRRGASSSSGAGQ